MTEFKRIAVAVWTSGRAADEGVGAWFDGRPRFVWLPFRERADADVLLFLAPQAAERALAAMRVPVDGLVRPSVFVADRLDARQVARATDWGMVRFLDHGTTDLPEIADALVSVVDGGESQAPAIWPRSWSPGTVPSDETDVAGTGLTAREIEVLRLLAAGSRIAEISSQLNYSERTIKGIVHGVVNRFGFRNRVQAVAYGVRVGVL